MKTVDGTNSLALTVGLPAVEGQDATSSTGARSRPRASGFGSNFWSGEDLYPISAGLLLALSLPPINLSFLAFVALVPLFLYLDKPATFRRTVRAGIFTGALFFGVTLSWLVAVGAYSWLAFPGYVVILFYHVLSFFAFLLPVVALRSYLSLPFLCTAPFAWVVCERLRSYGDCAFPWPLFGYALTKFPFLLQFADLAGVYGVSFWLVALNVLAYETIRAHGQPATWRRYAVLWLLAFGSVNLYNAVKWRGGVGPTSGHLRVEVIQPNIPQRIKWDERYGRQILSKVFALNATAAQSSPDLIVWPETAIPYFIDENRPFHLAEMGGLPQGESRILTGLLLSSSSSDGRVRLYNSAALFDSQGAMLERYKKIYLVPGSERYPFRPFIGFTRAFFNIQDIRYGGLEAGEEATVFTLPQATFSVMICYESAFPELSRAFRLRGSNFLVNITNDAWFGRSFAPYQHASFLVLRAIENRTAIVRCGNTGISGFIDPLGRWQRKTALFTEAIASGTIPLTQTLTFYTRFGDLMVYISFAVMGLFFLIALGKKYSAIPERRER